MSEHPAATELPPHLRSASAIRAATDTELRDVMGICHIEPTDPVRCLACLAYSELVSRCQSPSPSPPQNGDLRAAAEAWLSANPRVYDLFVRFALEAAAAGKPFGAKLLAERVRWEVMVASRDAAGFKVNNNHVAYVARRLVRDHPHLRQWLRFRQTRS